MSAKSVPATAIALALLLAASPLARSNAAVPNGDATTGHITGLGGIFVKSQNPRALAKWYRDTLGIKLEAWGGAKLSYDAPRHPAEAVWVALPQADTYTAPSTRDFMLNFAVDDLDAFLAKLTAKGVKILKRDDSDPTGKYAWILDPDGTKIELRESGKP